MLDDPFNNDDDDPEIINDPVYNMDLQTRIYHPSRLFIGGLHKAISELELENFFAEYGSITDVRIVCDKRTGESKGFGFVTFETPETRDNLLKLDKGHGQFASNAAAGNNGTPTTSGYPVQWVLVPTNNHHKEYYTKLQSVRVLATRVMMLTILHRQAILATPREFGVERPRGVLPTNHVHLWLPGLHGNDFYDNVHRS
ncbi:Protein boule-like [Exaiptasia diaphana]|nr:Protein boule-like [Exaiptasia diaphana]